MSNDNNLGGVFIIIIFLLRIGLPLYAGFKAWEMVEPESFFGFIGFLILWGIITTIIQFIAIGIISLFSNN
jgi:hypothetical protein